MEPLESIDKGNVISRSICNNNWRTNITENDDNINLKGNNANKIKDSG